MRSLLLLAGDIESNPGPTSETPLAELRNLLTGQGHLIAEMEGLKAQLGNTDKTIGELNKRITDLETYIKHWYPCGNKLNSCALAQSALLFESLSIDDAENPSR